MSRRRWRWLVVPLGVAAAVGGELAARARYRRLAYNPRAHGVLTLVALGDSITHGAPGPASAAWPALLEKHLQARNPSIAWRVVDAGVNGDTAPLGYSRFESDVALASPAAVFIAFGLNDCNPARYGLDSWRERQVPAGLERSYLWRAMRVRAERAGRALRLLAPPEVELAPRATARTAVEAYEAALAALVDRTRLIGAHPVLLTMTPLSENGSPDVTARLPAYYRYNETVRALAAAEGLPLVELGGGEPAGSFEPDGFHLTTVGQKWVADEIYRQLAATGFWDKVARNAGVG